MKSKLLKWTIRIIIALALIVLFVLSGFSLGERILFFSFYGSSERYEKIPGLWEGYIPQGYTSLDFDTRLACGYMKDGEASRIYIFNDGADTEYVELKKADGTDYTGHTGGIAVCGDTVYITGTTGCDLFSLADTLDGDGTATQTGEFATPNDPAYCTVYDGKLWVGSFYRAGNYETPTEHRFTTPSGDSNTAIIAVYELDVADGLPVSDTPTVIYSTPGLVQGAAFTDDGRIILSTSYGLSKSHLYVYDLEAAGAASNDIIETIEINGEDIALKFLDSSCLVDDIVAPPMAEEIIYADGKICIMNESASMKYLFGKLTSGNYVYAYKYE